MALRNINTVKYRRSIFTVSDNFLTKSPDLNADINYCIQVPQNTLNALNEYYTLLIDLNQTEEQIWHMQALKRTGVALAIDDFGTGYSSLSYLKRFPIDTLKIDQAFVRAMGSSSEDAAIVNLIMSLAKALNLKVVAEGVETPEQQAQLAALECDLLQGYLFSKPIPASDFAGLLQSLSSSS